MGRWLGEARRFVQVHTSALCMMPVWLFSSGPLGPRDHLIPAGEPADVKVLMRLSRAVAHRTFPGRLEMKQLHFAERTVARTIHAPEGDCRDWEEIDGFAAEIAEQLLGPLVSNANAARRRRADVEDYWSERRVTRDGERCGAS
jgi:menaquinone-dependent protoporphyrinogen oxidase